ncbi:MAG TPA: hypothetical protein PKY76_00275 [Bacteroidales bacterium]|nr:hypothetical protein [Bacteroidales bacterium]
MPTPVITPIAILYKSFLLIFIALFFQFQGKSQNPDNTVHTLEQSYFSHLYNFQFTRAYNALNSNLPSGNYYLWRMYYQWWMLLSTNDKTYLSQCFANIVLYETNRTMPDSLKIYFEAFRLRLMLFNHQYIKAYQQAVNLADNYKSYFHQFSNRDEQHLMQGLMNYLGAKAHRKYPLLFRSKSFQCFSDTLGLTLLKQCTTSPSIFVRTEGLYFLVKIYLEIEEDYKQAYVYSTQLISLFPGNIIFGLLHQKILTCLHKGNEAKIYQTRLLDEISNNKELTESQKKYLKQMINPKI